MPTEAAYGVHPDLIDMQVFRIEKVASNEQAQHLAEHDLARGTEFEREYPAVL